MEKISEVLQMPVKYILYYYYYKDSLKQCLYYNLNILHLTNWQYKFNKIHCYTNKNVNKVLILTNLTWIVHNRSAVRWCHHDVHHEKGHTSKLERTRSRGPQHEEHESMMHALGSRRAWDSLRQSLAEKLKKVVGGAARVNIAQRCTSTLLLNVPEWDDAG